MQCCFNLGSATATTVIINCCVPSWIPLTVSRPPAEIRILVQYYSTVHTLAPVVYMYRKLVGTKNIGSDQSKYSMLVNHYKPVADYMHFSNSRCAVDAPFTISGSPWHGYSFRSLHIFNQQIVSTVLKLHCWQMPERKWMYSADHLVC